MQKPETLVRKAFWVILNSLNISVENIFPLKIYLCWKYISVENIFLLKIYFCSKYFCWKYISVENIFRLKIYFSWRCISVCNINHVLNFNTLLLIINRCATTHISVLPLWATVGYLENHSSYLDEIFTVKSAYLALGGEPKKSLYDQQLPSCGSVGSFVQVDF